MTDPEAERDLPLHPRASRRDTATRRWQRRFVSLRDQLRATREEFRQGKAGHLSRLRFVALFTLEIFAALGREFSEFRVSQRAAGVAFFTALGVVPFLLVLVLVAEYTGLSRAASEYIIDVIITNYVPVEREQALETLDGWIMNARTAAAGTVGLLVLLIAALNVYSGYYTLINDLWHVPSKGRFGHRARTALTVFLVGPLLLVATASVSASIVGQVSRLPVGGWLASHLTSFALIWLIAFLGVRLIPRARVHAWSASLAALFAAFLFEISKFGFAYYVNTVLQTAWFRIYGAIFLLPVLLLWTHFVALIIAASSSLAWLLQNWRRELLDEPNGASGTPPGHAQPPRNGRIGSGPERGPNSTSAT